MNENKILLSGIQPSGDIHIGNYIGAIKNWVKLIPTHNSLFTIVDYHAITANYPIPELKKRILDAAIVNIACGIDPKNSAIFIQSHVAEHTELAWIFNCVTPLGELYRMTQFKEKSKQNEANINAGLLTYPVLQAADILLYKAVAVPVGEDQVQHIELTREIARYFNKRFGEVFPEPAAITPTSGGRIMGLDGKSKMSKSLGNHIAINDSFDIIKTKLKNAFTDPARIRLKDPGNPDICNIFTIHAFFTEIEQIKSINEKCRKAEIGCFECKEILANGIYSELSKIQEKILSLKNDIPHVESVLQKGAENAGKIAKETMVEVRKAIGIR